MELQKKRQEIEKKFYEFSREIVSSHGLELYGLEYQGKQKRLILYIENPETKTAHLDDCVLIDKAMTSFIEEGEWVPEDLTLEVSSPGIYREIFEAHQLKRYLGERLKIQLFTKLEQEGVLSPGNPKELKAFLRQKKFEAYLVNFSEEEIILSPTLESELKIRVPLGQIKRANVEPLWEDIRQAKGKGEEG